MDYQHYFKSCQGEMIRCLKEAVDLESPSADKDAVDRCMTYVSREFQRAGATVTILPQDTTGDFLLAEYPPRQQVSDSKQILVLAHADTVWPVGKLKTMPFYVEGNKIFGPGTLDMKAGLVMILFAIRTLNKLNILPSKRIVVFVNSAEEIGSEQAYTAIRNLAKKSSCVLCLEPAIPGGALKIQRKGRLVIRLETRGRSAHAGSPGKGINAIEELLFQLRTLLRSRTSALSINIGLIEGGDKPNVVPASSAATLDIRFWNHAQKENFLISLKQLEPHLSGASVESHVISHTPPMERHAGSNRLLQQIKRTASSMNISLSTGRAGGGSDASIASSMGIATVDGLGPDGEGIHAEHEHVIIPSFIERTALLTRLLEQL